MDVSISRNRTSEARRLARIRESCSFAQLDLSPANRADRLPFRTPKKMRYLFAWWAQIRGGKRLICRSRQADQARSLLF
jgi:hypothetical protein